MTKIFVNYRSQDEPQVVELVANELAERFGVDSVFFASRSIRLGADWARTMFTAVTDSTALLAFIGRHWLVGKDGKRPIHDPDDFVRREILVATELRKIIIPVRVCGAARVPADELPEALRGLATLQDIELRFRNTGPDIDRLVADLRKQIPELRGKEPSPEPVRPVSVNKAYAEQIDTLNQFGHVNVSGDFNAGSPHGR